MTATTITSTASSTIAAGTAQVAHARAYWATEAARLGVDWNSIIDFHTEILG